MKLRYLNLAVAVLLIPIGAAGLVTATPASADCVGTGTSTVCAQGTVRGGGPAGGASYPSTCYDPWYCDDGWDVDLNLYPGRPGNRPPNGGGGRPPNGGGGNRPGGGGGGIGPR